MSFYVEKGLKSFELSTVKMRESVFQVLEDFNDFAMNGYGEVLNELALNFLKPFSLSEGQELNVYSLYTWWTIFSQPLTKNQRTIAQAFYAYYVKKRRMQVMNHLFSQWKEIRPSFYTIQSVKSEYMYVLSDLFGGQMKTTVAYHPTLYIPSCGDLVSALLFPIGDGTYTYFFDFFYFPKYKTLPILNELSHVSQKYGNRDHITLLKNYPGMLSKAIQVMVK